MERSVADLLSMLLKKGKTQIILIFTWPQRMRPKSR